MINTGSKEMWGIFTVFSSNLPSKTKVAYEYFADCEDPPEFMIMQDDDTVADVGKIRFWSVTPSSAPVTKSRTM